MPLTRFSTNRWLGAGPGRQTRRVDASVEIRPIDLLDDAQTDDVQRWVAVYNAIQDELFGDKGSEWTVEELRGLQRRTDSTRLAVAAWSGREIVGALRVMMPLRDNLRLAVFWPAVVASARGRGIGSVLVTEAERLGMEHGRSTFLTETEWAGDGTDLAEDFARHRGYAIAQTMLRSEMALPADGVGLQAIIDAPGAAGYVIESCVDDLPESWLEDRAVLTQRMSTDAPTDDLDWEEEAWDAERVREVHEAIRASGRRVVESVARHQGSGALVAFTRVEVSPESPDRAYQQDTLVLREHRGHGLGARLKAANALLLTEALPTVQAIRTWNADSNTHMLAVNRALGYLVDGYSREWQKQLATGGVQPTNG